MEFYTLDKAPKELFDLWYGLKSIYWHFLPSNKSKITFCKADNGFLLKRGMSHSNYYLPLGDITNFDQFKDLEGGITFILFGKYCDTTIPIQNTDFIFDWSELDLKKYKRRNSTIRRIQEDNITIKHFDSMDMLLQVEIENLYNKWATKTKSNADTENHFKYYKDLFEHENMHYICYYRDNKLVGAQTFELIGRSVYWQMDFIDYENIGRSCIQLVHPLEYFNRIIHILGALPNDKRLYDYKMRICKGKFYTFIPVQFNSKTKNKEEKLEYIKQLYLENK